MFYSVFVLGKRGPLAKIWLAAHCRKKLKKNDILSINISQAVEAILQSRVRMSLRLMSHLMVGVTVIHNRQTNHLLADLEHCRIVSSFKFGGNIDAPENKLVAKITDINLPDIQLEEDFFDQAGNDGHEIHVPTVSRHEMISFRESEPDFRDITESISDRDAFSSRFGDGPSFIASQSEIVFDDHIFRDDGFGGRPYRPPEELFNLFSQDLNQEVPIDESPPGVDQIEIGIESASDREIEEFNLEPFIAIERLQPPQDEGKLYTSIETPRQGSSRQSRILDAGELVLSPIEQESVRKKRPKKSKKFIIDDRTSISRGEFNQRLGDASDTVNPIEAIIITKKQAILQKKSNVKYLLKSPSCEIASRQIEKVFNQRFVTKPYNDDWSLEDEGFISQSDQAVDEMQQEVQPDVDLSRQRSADNEREIGEKEASQMRLDEIIEGNVDKRSRKRKKERELSPSNKIQKSRKQRRSRDTSMSRYSQETPRRGSDFFYAGLGFNDDMEFSQDSFVFSRSLTSQEQESFIADISSTSAEVLKFTDLMKNCHRREVAFKFYTLLALHKQGIIKLIQKTFYDEIFIHKIPMVSQT